MTETRQEIVINKSWEELISRGMEAREDKDTSQWKLGDLATEVTTEYGNDSIGKFAYAINLDKKTIMNYRTVSSKFKQHTRSTYKKLSFSHFAALTSIEKPEAWLEKADDEDWSVETLRSKIKESYPKDKNIKDDPPPRVYRCEECGRWRLEGVSAFDICKGHYQLTKNGLTYK